jgi:hypothetical protein
VSREVARFAGCNVDRETDRALLVFVPDLEEQIWVPKSVVHEDSEVYKADTDGELVVFEWWATKKGLV